jgi:hypothetical protein
MSLPGKPSGSRRAARGDLFPCWDMGCRPAGRKPAGAPICAENLPFARDRKLTHERPTRRGGRRGKAAKERINVSAVAAQSKRIVVSKVVTIACDHSTSVARSVSFASADPGPVLRLGPGSLPEGATCVATTSDGLHQSRQKSLNPVRRQGRVDRSARDRSMAEPSLDCPGVVPLVGERVPAGMAEHVRVRLQLEAGTRGSTLDHPGEAGRRERRSPLADKDKRRRRVGAGGAVLFDKAVSMIVTHSHVGQISTCGPSSESPASQRVKNSVKNSVRRFKIEEVWSEWQDLNLRPPRPERGALPDRATLRFCSPHIYPAFGFLVPASRWARFWAGSVSSSVHSANSCSRSARSAHHAQDCPGSHGRSSPLCRCRPFR